MSRPTALISAARGIGDILRVTPLARVCLRLGYDVDLLLAPDYPGVAELLERSDNIRRVFLLPGPWSGAGQRRTDGLDRESYDVAVFTTWSLTFRHLVRARRTLAFDQSAWLRDGDTASIRRIARALGWTEPLPPPFASPSSRRFALADGTVALHPGCKPDWPWKKWHGFEDLARRLPHVAIVGSPHDAENARTYFGRAFVWPAHVQDFAGALSLPDTAALVSQCAALVANDSGLMHLGVALGVPTFGIFGITSPQRESIDAPNMFAITKRLPCEPACRLKPWGRRDCEHHLKCLRTLDATDVCDRIDAVAPGLVRRVTAPPDICGEPRVDELSIRYYGHVFDATGYGQAARGYLHALHAAGVRLSVTDLMKHERQVRDDLVESLVGRQIEPDFHLFHGIPPQWARLAFPLRNAIGMTVWETDTMPLQWRNVLSHVLEVWLPCEFNVSVFSRDLRTPTFKLPHAVLARRFNGDVPDEAIADLRPGDFVFYSVFEWQDRKCPAEMLSAFLSAFPTEEDAVLVIKTSPSAARVAAQALAGARERTPSRARILIRAEAWSEGRLESLHRRGNCYVSLHRGEGWCYPLFEAASRGKPVVATGYAGPLEYLSPDFAELVPYQLVPVRQPYLYYHPTMRWAEPDVTSAAERLRWVYMHRDVAQARAAEAADRIRVSYSPDSVGHMAREELLRVLRRNNPSRFRRLVRARAAKSLKPPVPVPGEWYDAGYFEEGVKSNWQDGYTWASFAGVFTETAAFLTATFPDAVSYLDVGCAKGFLVRALRAAGKDCWGVDHSAWALEHAEPATQPYLIHASADELSLDRQFDFILAFGLLPHLTEQQAHEFLRRARTTARLGVIAVIRSFDTDDEERRYREANDDGDLSHILMRTRRWWHEMFLKAGWRQDPLHRALEHACRNHELPRKMSWQLYIYATP